MPERLNNSAESHRAEIAAVAFALVYPSLLTWLYFVALAERPASVQQAVYGIGKTAQFAFPLVWVLLIRRERPRLRWTISGLPWGVAFGLAAAAAIYAVHRLWLLPHGGAVSATVAARVTKFGIVAPAAFIALGTFYSLVHSLLEEYYWRWFVFGRLRQRVRPGTAIALSSLGFMAHHVILLSVYFGLSAITALSSLAVAVGGAVWAWMYHRDGSLLGPWISHLLVDAAIFTAGYEMFAASN